MTRKELLNWLAVVQIVFELVRMLAVGDDDRHLARQSGQFVGTRIGHNSDTQRRLATIHRASVLEYEGSAPAVQPSGHHLDGNITRRTLHDGTASKHLAFAGGFEITLEFLVDGQPPQTRIALRWLGIQSYLKRSTCRVHPRRLSRVYRASRRLSLLQSLLVAARPEVKRLVEEVVKHSGKLALAIEFQNSVAKTFVLQQVPELFFGHQ